MWGIWRFRVSLNRSRDTLVQHRLSGTRRSLVRNLLSIYPRLIGGDAPAAQGRKCSRTKTELPIARYDYPYLFQVSGKASPIPKRVPFMFAFAGCDLHHIQSGANQPKLMSLLRLPTTTRVAALKG